MVTQGLCTLCFDKSLLFPVKIPILVGMSVFFPHLIFQTPFTRIFKATSVTFVPP